MDEKDKKIQQLERDIAKLKNAYNVLERKVQALTSRVIQTDATSRKMASDIVKLERR